MAQAGTDSNSLGSQVGSDSSFVSVSESATTYAPSYTTEGLEGGVSAIEASHRRRRSRRRVRIVLLAVSVLMIVGICATAFAYVMNFSSNLREGLESSLFDTLVPVDTTDPFYVLLMGTDGSEARSQMEEFAGDNYRTDSIILARVDPAHRKVALISIPRDTKVRIQGYGTQKINAAHAIGGATLAVETVSEVAGVPISHYAEVDFDGFSEIVDRLGGIEVDVPVEIDDDEAGGHLDAGLQTLSGEQALILCRSRYTYEGAGDLLRAANQRLVLSSIAAKILSSNVFTMASTISALSRYITTDMSINEIVSIAQSMSGLDPDKDIYTAAAPTTSSYENGVAYEILDSEAFADMIERVDSGLPPTVEDEVDETTGIVMASTGGEEGVESSASQRGNVSITRNATFNIRNGNGRSGLCAEAQGILEDMGYQASNMNSGNADSYNYEQTLVVYKDEGLSDEAEAISDELGCGRALYDDTGRYLFNSDFLVVIGSDWP